MITKFMTEVTAKFNPFSTCAKPARLFLTFLPPNVRASGTAVHTALLPRNSPESSSLKVKFSTPMPREEKRNDCSENELICCAEDGKEMDFNCSKINIKSLVEEVDRHSRQLQKAADLSD
jgi:large subunit ribosomal protein L53